MLKDVECDRVQCRNHFHMRNSIIRARPSIEEPAVHSSRIQFTRVASSVLAQLFALPSRTFPLIVHIQTYHIHTMSPSATTELGPASGPDVQLKPQEAPTHKAPRQHASHEEYQYLDLIRDILEEGEHRPDRYITLPSYC